MILKYLYLILVISITLSIGCENNKYPKDIVDKNLEDLYVKSILAIYEQCNECINQFETINFLYESVSISPNGNNITIVFYIYLGDVKDGFYLDNYCLRLSGIKYDLKKDKIIEIECSGDRNLVIYNTSVDSILNSNNFNRYIIDKHPDIFEKVRISDLTNTSKIPFE